MTVRISQDMPRIGRAIPLVFFPSYLSNVAFFSYYTPFFLEIDLGAHGDRRPFSGEPEFLEHPEDGLIYHTM